MAQGNFSYESGSVISEALHWIRSAIADKRADRAFLDDGQIAAALAEYGLAVDSDPIANRYGVHMAAADCAEMIAAELGQQSQIALTELGTVKSTAAGEYRTTAKLLRKKVTSSSGVSFAHPESFAPNHVWDVDDAPDYEEVG